jgi:hypothetical protein
MFTIIHPQAKEGTHASNNKIGIAEPCNLKSIRFASTMEQLKIGSVRLTKVNSLLIISISLVQNMFN